MEIDAQTLNIIGIVYSALALAISIPSFIVLETPTKSLIYLQLSYLLSQVGSLFSLKLHISCADITLSPEAQSQFYCTLTNYVCTLAFPLTFLVFLAGFLLIFRFVTIPEAVRNKGLTYPRVHRWCKGLIRWVVMYIAYFSLKSIIILNEAVIAPAAVMLALCVIFPIVQVILYWKFPQQKSSHMNKWIQLLDYTRILLFSLLVVLSEIYSTAVPYYFIILVLALYGFFYFYYYEFRFTIVGRIFHTIGELVMVLNIAMIVSGSSEMITYYLDIFFLGAVLLIDVIYVPMECLNYYRNRDKALSEVVPQNSDKINQQRYDTRLNDSGDQLASDVSDDNNRSGVYKSKSKPLKKR